MGFSLLAYTVRLYLLRILRLAVSLASAGVYTAIAFLTYLIFIGDGYLQLTPAEIPSWILNADGAVIYNSFVAFPVSGIGFSLITAIYLVSPNKQRPKLHSFCASELRIALASAIVVGIFKSGSIELLYSMVLAAIWLTLALSWYSVWTEKAEGSTEMSELEAAPLPIQSDPIAENRFRSFRDFIYWLGIESAKPREGQNRGQGKHDDGDDAVQNPPKDGASH